MDFTGALSCVCMLRLFCILCYVFVTCTIFLNCLLLRIQQLFAETPKIYCKQR